MRKFFAILMAVTLAISAAALPVFAEETGESTDQISSATQAKGGNSNSRRQKPDNSRTPGRNNQMPEQGSQAPDQSSQMPEQGSQAPDQSSQMPEQGSQAPDPSSQTPEQGSQATDQSGQTPGQGSQAPGQGNRKAQSGQPARPGKNGRGANRGNQSSDPVQSWKSITGMLVDPARLLDAGIITREIYDAIVSYMNEHASQQAEGTAAPA